MNSSAQITTKNGRLIARISLIFFILANFIWLLVVQKPLPLKIAWHMLPGMVFRWD